MSEDHTTAAHQSVLSMLWPMLIIAGMAINLRPTLTAIGPLLDDITATTGLGLQAASLLTVLPMLCMGIFALLLPWLGRLFSESVWITAGLVAIALASFWRLWLNDSGALIASALLAGTGIAIVQAILPGLVKRWYPQRVPLAMGGYSASLMAGGGIAAVISPLVANHQGHWQSGLGIWLIPALIALLLWWTRPRENLHISDNSVKINFFTNRRAWLLACYFGLANGGYACMIAWLPSYAQELGWSAQDSGELIGIMTIFQVIGALAAPALSAGRLDRRPWLFFAVGIQLVGFCGLMLAPELMLTSWVAMIGYGLGGCFALTLTVTLDHLSSPKLAGALTAFVQGVGFIVTAVIPYIAGALRQWSGSFQTSWLMVIVTLAFMFLVTVTFSPSRYAKAMNLTAA
tara:strand:+ start:1637 stop:2845 length:1209 start_codon:yes stop_codon:yes gene_type:complete